MIDFLKLIWLLIPAGVANMIPPITAKIWPKWNAPIDDGKKWKGKPILGSHKTWRGLITGVISAEIVYLVLLLVVSHNIDWPWWFGGMLGLVGLIGDMVKSFFKRRVGVKSGNTWFPWDQIDWIIGVILFGLCWGLLNFAEIVTLLVIGLLLHMLFKLMGYALKINKTAI